MALKNGNKLLWAIHILGILFWVSCFFFGLTYHKSLIISIPVSLILGGFLFLFVLGMYKQKTKTVYEAGDKLFNLLYKILYAAISLFSFILLLHFIFITTIERNNIKEDARRQYFELKQILNEEDPNGYVKSYVEPRLVVFEKSLITENTPSEKIKNEIELKTTEFMEEFHRIKNDFTESSSNKNIGNLDYIIWMDDVQSLLENLYETKNKCINDLIESSREIDFEYRPYKPASNKYTENLKNRLTFDYEKIDSSSLIYSVLLAVIFQFLILLVYFVTPRGNKSFRGKGKVAGISSI